MVESNDHALPDLSTADLSGLLELVENSDVTLLRLRSGEAELALGRAGATLTSAPMRPAVSLPATPSPVGSVPPMARLEERPSKQEASPTDTVSVRAPLSGTFYRATAPGAPPYVEIGTEVNDDTTVGLIEAMKVFVSVHAGLRGIVERIDAVNESPVEAGEEILWVRPIEH